MQIYNTLFRSSPVKLQQRFVRYVGDPIEGAAELGKDEAPKVESDQHRDCVSHSAKVDIQGYPVQRIAVVVRGPEGANLGALKLTGRVFLFEEHTRAWHQVGDELKIIPGRVSTFDIVSPLEDRGVRSPIEAFLLVGGTGPEGMYVFAFGPDVSNPGT